MAAANVRNLWLAGATQISASLGECDSEKSPTKSGRMRPPCRFVSAFAGLMAAVTPAASDAAKLKITEVENDSDARIKKHRLNCRKPIYIKQFFKQIRHTSKHTHIPRLGRPEINRANWICREGVLFFSWPIFVRRPR